MKTLRAQTFRLWLLCCVLLKLMWCDCVDCVAFKCLYFFFLIFNVYLVYEFIIYIYSRHYFFRPLAQSRMLYKHCTKQGMTATASNQSQRCWARRPHFPAETERRILWVRQWIMWPVWQSADFLDKLKHEVYGNWVKDVRAGQFIVGYLTILLDAAWFAAAPASVAVRPMRDSA